MLIDCSYQKVSNWFDSALEAQTAAAGFVAAKAMVVSEAAIAATNDGLDRTLEIDIAEDP
jgi:hypothetical protein